MPNDDASPRACDLCGLDVETDEFTIHANDRTLKFCCEGCVGIYRMLNDVEDAETTNDRAAE